MLLLLLATSKQSTAVDKCVCLPFIVLPAILVLVPYASSYVWYLLSQRFPDCICGDFFSLVYRSYFNRNNTHTDNLITAWCTATCIIKFGTVAFECYILCSIWCTRIIISSFLPWSVTMLTSRMLLLTNLAYSSVTASSCIVSHWNRFITTIT